MSIESKITAVIESIPFADLYVHPMNPRGAVDEAGIATLAENIRALGLIQNLAGLRDDDGRVGIVAGGRRLRALALLRDDPRFETVPVRIAPDAATARVWAASENHLREALHPADEIRDYADLAARGAAIPEIAIAFGVADAHVRRRLKLAALPGPVLEALRADEISLGAAACFTICDDLAHALGVLEQARGRSFDEHRLRRLLKPAAIRDGDRRARFVGLDAYRAAGGRISHDLFADEVYLDDPDILDACFAEKLAGAAEELRAAEGWRWVRTAPESYMGYGEIEALGAARLYPEFGVWTEEEAVRQDALARLAEADALDEAGAAELDRLNAIVEGDYTAAQKEHSGIICYVTHSGAVKAERGLVLPEDQPAAIEAGVLAERAGRGEGEAKRQKSLISAALAEDLARVARGARQHAMLGTPDLLLDLLAFELSGRIGHGHAFGLRVSDVPNQPGTATGFALDPRLIEPAPRPENPWDFDRAAAFRAFRAEDAGYRRGELLRHLTALLTIDDRDLAALIDAEAKTEIRAVWTPTAENFLGRVSGATLEALWAELLDLAPEHPTMTAFAKLRKGEKAARLESLFADEATRASLKLSKKQRARIDAWLPEGMG
ncbi:MAG: chromosome partitioning protein ParB [Rhodovulum sulfidophilum]|uniref:Chromosome partitioning protein ParB n=1 Tax=Rhodovulum sulfidophilum TaxID=35806 RepID=A0A2W5MYN5_RHOSU|nr:MAG: chromosome partitioning protein ParB [Rhodovulum sulfidophilum]